jgi:hypothetical protein
MGRGKPFEPGNTAGKGRPPRSLNKKTIFQEELGKDGAAIIQKIKQRALKADPMAMRLCMERLVPLAKAPDTRFRLPAVGTGANLTEAISAVTEAVAEGEMSAQEGELMARIVESQRRNIEVEEFEARIKALETTPAETGRRNE